MTEKTFECEMCGRKYGHADEADRCPCEATPSKCELCNEPVPPEDLITGLCANCLLWIEEEADRAAHQARQQ
jgi:hypothetical protein